MSTRANIIVRDESGDELIFYRHSDGYPEGRHGVLRSLEGLMLQLKLGHVRDNVSQFSGWLVVIGRQDVLFENEVWKASSIEPTTDIHGDIEYLYVIDLDKKEILIDGERDFEYEGKYS